MDFNSWKDILNEISENSENTTNNLEQQNILKKLVDIFRDPIYNFRDRCRSLQLVHENDSDLSQNETDRLLHSIIYLEGKEKSESARLLMALSVQPWLTITTRCQCAIICYQEADLQSQAYEIFSNLATDFSIGPKYRSDACKFLVFSALVENEDTAQKVMSELMNDKQWSDEEKIDAALSFTNEYGMRTLFLSEPLFNEYNEDFISPVILAFFANNKHKLRLRLIAAEFLLQTSAADLTDNENEQSLVFHNRIMSSLYKEASQIMEEQSVKEYHRLIADVADVMMQLGSDDWKKEGEGLLNKIRWTDVPELQQNIYTDAENIHDEKIRKGLMDFIHDRFVIGNQPVAKKNVFDTILDISNDIYRLSSAKAQIKAMESLQRIKRDQIKYGQTVLVTPIQVLVYIWQYVHEYYPKNEQKRYIQTFMQEMVWMADTCSSGHVGRLLNVLNIDETKESTFKISFESQIIANIQARLMAGIKKIEDEDFKGQILMGLVDNADEEDKEARRKYSSNVRDNLYQELLSEFVGGDFINKDEFDTIFGEQYAKWLA